MDRRLHWTDTWVYQIAEIVDESLDPETLATFPDQTTSKLLEVHWNQAQYTRILSALAVGAELIYPYQAQQVYYDFLKVRNSEAPPEDTCKDYTTDTTEIITFAPQDPYTEPDVTPPGYLMPPFWVVGDVLPEFLPDWFAEIITDIVEQFTGYEDDDVLATIGSIPLFANWLELLEDGLPRFTITVEDAGTLELHLLSVPLGGRLLVSVDIDFDLVDIIEGIITDGFKLIELERDYSSAPPELDVDHIEEIVLEAAGSHVIYCTFLPVVDLDAIPLKFGGGIRKVVWCPDNIPDEPCEECPEELTIPEIIADDTYFETEYVPKVFGEYYSETVAQAAAQAAIYDDTPQSVAPDVPVAAPNAVEKNALCYAVNRFVDLYSSQKLCLIQSQNWLENLLSDMANAANDFYNTAANLMLPFYSANIFSCFVDDAAAMTALQDDAAIEELACYLYEELKTVAMSQANFDAAILDAATTLTGNAQDIACLMQNDSSEDIFIAFLLGYNIAIERQNAGDDLECPCETDTYWMKVYDFSLGAHGWVGVVSGTTLTSAHVGDRFSGVGTQSGCLIRLNSFGNDYIIRACGIQFEGLGLTGVGTDGIRAAGWSTENVSGTERLTGNVGFLTQATFDAAAGLFEYRDIPEGLASASYQASIQNAGTKSGSNYMDIMKIVLYGLPNTGIKPPGSVWVPGVPVAPAPLFPS